MRFKELMKKNKVRLGVNIDHVATLREVRKGLYPDPVRSAKICEASGADSIVCHLREDRRHIQEKDVKRLLETLRLPLNLEMSMADEIVQIARRLKPYQVTLVPERRKELTTEGGLDVVSHQEKLKRLFPLFQRGGIRVSLFIDPVTRQLDASQKIGAKIVEFHTGRYARARTLLERKNCLKLLAQVCREAKQMNLELAAGHGLNYQNVRPVARIPEIEELNIGHAIISHALFVGLADAVQKMRRFIP